MIKLQEVSKIFYINKNFDQGINDIKIVRRQPFFALKDINLKIDRGEFVVLTGPNGSGKTTLLKIIAGIFRPSQGQAMVKSLPSHFINLPPSYLLVKNFLFKNQITVAHSEKFTDKLIRDLSLGMQARLMGSLILAQDREIILLDDFFFASDKSFQNMFFTKAKNRNKTIVVASHNPESLKDYSTKIIKLKNGQIKN